MKDVSSDPRALAVPAGRLTRFARLGGVTAGIAGNVAWRALGEASRGGRPNMQQLLLSPGNLHRLAEELARMRGAAMKVGQLISMDTGDVLPPELAEILARLRDQAHFMPPKQLRQVLNVGWGPDWMRQFHRFDVRPIAAASIGQVHRAQLKDGRDIAIKVQYPGIARSIDSDVANVGALVKLSGLVPKGFDIAPYLEEARKQLHDETDYALEGRYLQQFGTLLEGQAPFRVPAFHGDWSGPGILAMSYEAGGPIEAVAAEDQDTRNRVMGALVTLMLREIFEFGLTQSDPNFANYRFDTETSQVVLLDFGATRALDPALTEGYKALMRAGLARDRSGLHAAAMQMGFLDGGPFDAQILTMMETVFEAVCAPELFDFSDRSLSQEMNRQGRALAEAGYVPPQVPMDALYLQRKFGGMFLLGGRLEAVLPMRDILAGHIGG